MDNIIEITDLKKYFGTVKAVDGITFSVRRGELFSFLGLNGAGKSTTISVICSTLKKDSGKILIDGTEIEKAQKEIKSKLGVVFQSSVLDKPLSVYDNLRSRASLYGIVGKAFKKRLSELDDMLNLKEFLYRPVSKLSGGQRRRVDIARAIIHSPELLILDEPTTGLDPHTRKNVWSVIDSLRKNAGMTVFLTTHYMEEAAESDYIVILDQGKISAEGTPLELKNKYASDSLLIYTDNEDSIKALDMPYERISDGFKICVPDTSKAVSLITENPSVFRDFELTKGKMDDVFLAVTGKKLTGGGAHENS